MELTKLNFSFEWPKIAAEMAASDFIALDFEMTGIRLQGAPLCEFDDSVAKHFDEKFEVARHYTVVQVGFCLFKKNAEGQFEARPFTAFVFPAEGASDVVLNVETTSSFLADTGMDFNKWIKSGIRYRPMAHGTMQSSGADSRSSDYESAAGALPDPDRGFVQQLMVRMKSFALQSRAGEKMSIPFVKNSEGFRIVEDYAKLLRLTKETRRVGPRPEHMWVAPGQESGDSVGLVHMGFTVFFEHLARLQKPVVVHNGFSDLLFLHHWFDRRPDVSDYCSFQTAMFDKFPRLLDTRVVMTRPSAPTSEARFPPNLVGFHGAIMQLAGERAATVTLPMGFSAYAPGLLRDCKGASAAHEAGFDALLTGIVAINAAIVDCGKPDLTTFAPLFNQIGVHACLSVACLRPGAKDVVNHNGFVLKAVFPRAGLLSAADLERLLSDVGLRSRVQMSTGMMGGFAFVASDDSVSTDILSHRLKAATQESIVRCGAALGLSLFWQPR